MAKRIKVLHLQQQCSIRIADLQEEIIAALPVTHYEVFTAYLTDTPETSTSGVHSRSERVKYFNFKKNDIKGLRLHLMKTLYDFCREEQFDLVITHRFKPLDIMLKLNKLLNIPHCICVVHNLDDFNRFYRRLNARILVDSRWMFVAVSEAVNQYLINIGHTFTKKNVITINNAIDTDKLLSRIFSKEEARRQLDLAENSFIFGTTGRIVTVKGYIYLIQAFEKLYSQHQNEDIKLVIIGDGKLKNQLQEYVNNKGLHKLIIFPGEIIDAKLVMSAFDVFVLSSLSEGFSLVVLEAMAAKLPIIATQVGIVPEIITQKDEIIQPKDINHLSQVMGKYYHMSSQQRELLGNNLFISLIKKFDIKSYREKYLKLITEQIRDTSS